MNIGIVCYPTFGGSGVLATELGLELSRKGHEIHFITYSQPVRLELLNSNVHFHEVNVPEYPLFHYQPYELALSSKLVDMVKIHKIDVLHVHYAIPHASAAFMAKQILAAQGVHIPYVTTLHGTDITLVGRDPSFEPVIAFCINESDAVTAVSESLREDTYKHFNATKDILVIPNFVHPRSKTIHNIQEIRRRYANDNESIMCHISNFRKVKRVDDVLKMFDKVNQKIPSKLLMVGDGPERYGLEELCAQLGLCDRVVFIGKVRETQEVLEISDLFVLPSETESFGLAALEAMAMGVPVISSNTGGIPEVNINGETGFMSDVGDVEDMAKNAIYILEDEDRKKNFGENALARSKVFDIDTVVCQYEDLYKTLI